jgi:cyclic-di-GMP-binding protein
MSSLFKRLGEALPERRPPSKDAFQADARQLKRWLDALPLANAGVAARMLYQALRELNRMTLDPVYRLSALEMMRVPLGQLADAIDRQIVGSTFPLPPAKAALGASARELQKEAAEGYRIAAVELCAPEGKVPFLRGKAAALALERAIAHLGAELCKGYFLYATPPEGLWRMMNTCFAFARAIKVDDKEVDDAQLNNAGISPRISYMHALLLAISNPYRLAQKEVHEAYHVTRAWAPLCTLHEGAGKADEFTVPTDEDRGPGYLPEERSSDVGAMLCFSAAPLQRELERQLQLSANVGGNLSFRYRQANATTVSPELVRRLMQSWQPLASRHHARLPAGHELDTLVGLHAVHYSLAGGVDFESFVRRACGTVLHASERERLSGWAANGADAGKPETLRARVIDQSLGGYRLEWNQSDTARARIGELIAVAPVGDDDDERDWMVGQIRWLRLSPDGKVDAGVELLARRARPSVLRALDQHGHPRPSVRAVWLENPHAGQAPANGNGNGNGHANGNGNGGAKHSILAPSVLERGAQRYEVRTTPDRYSDAEEPDVRVLQGISVVEQFGSYIRLVPTDNAVVEPSFTAL